MNREQAETLLAVLVADELDEPRRGELLAYLKTDPALAERVGDMRLAARLLREGLEQASADAPSALDESQRAELLALAEREPITANAASPAVSAGAGSAEPSVLYSFRIAGAAAACVALGVGLLGVALPEMGAARRTARRMQNAPPATAEPGYAYGYNIPEDDAEVPTLEMDAFGLHSDVRGTLRTYRTYEIESREGSIAGYTDGHADKILDQVAGTLANDLAEENTDFFSAGPVASAPSRTPGARPNVGATIDTSRSATGDLTDRASRWEEAAGPRVTAEMSMVEGRLPEVQPEPSAGFSGVLADGRAGGDRVTRDASGMLGPATGRPALGIEGVDSPDLDGDTRAGGRGGRIAGGGGGGGGGDGVFFEAHEPAADSALAGDPADVRFGYGDAPADNAPANPNAPGGQALADGWAGSLLWNDNHVGGESDPSFESRYDNGRELSAPDALFLRQLGESAAPANDPFSFSIDLPFAPSEPGGFIGGGQHFQRDFSIAGPGLGVDVDPSEIAAQVWDERGRLATEDLGVAGGVVVVRPRAENGLIESENEALLFPGLIVDGEEAPGFDLNGALSNGSSGRERERELNRMPDSPGVDLIDEAREQLAGDKLAQAAEASRQGQDGLAAQLYEEAQLLDPGEPEIAERLAEARRRTANPLQPIDPLVDRAQDITVARQETTARYERAMERASQAMNNKDFAEANDAVVEARTLLNANRSAFSEQQRNEMVARAAAQQSSINNTRAMDEANRIARAEMDQERHENVARDAAEDRRTEQVQQRLRNARALQMERKYEDALVELEGAQFIDPNNAAVEALRDILQDVSLSTESTHLDRQLDLMRANQQLINDEAVIPYDELLTYPGAWPELTQMRLAGLAGGESESAANQTTQLALQQVMTFNAENAKLGSIIDYVRDVSGANIAVNWPALELTGVTPDTPVSLTLSRVPADQFLKLVLEQAGASSEGDDKLGYSIIEGIVQVTTLDDLRPWPQVRVYDINAILDQASGISREEQLAQIIELIKDTVDEPDRWLDEEYTIRALNGNLIVKATGEAHQELLGLIGRLGFETEDPAQAEPPAVPPVNPWVLTEHDAQSTFALDTDTASYELARRTIREQAQLPPVAAVRMEEFVNRFDYQYPAGRDAHDTFTVHAEAGDAPFAEDGVVLLKVGVRGRVVARDQMKPAHYVFVIDASGSMAREDRLPLVQRSLAMLLGQLGAADTVSLVSYETRPYLLLEHAPASDARAILDAAATIQTGGSTNLTDGLKLGYQVAARHFEPGSVNRVILCSDGVANVGSDDAQQMLDAVDEYRQHGVTLMTVGVGVDGQTIGGAASGGGAEGFNDGLMEQLANRGDGQYLYLGSVEDARRQFVEDLAATRPTIAYDAKIQVHFDPSRVRRYRLIGYENRDIADRDFRNDAVDAGEVGSGQSATALYEVELWPTPGGRVAGGVREDGGILGTVYVRYRDARSDAVEETATALSPGVVRERTVADDPRFYLAACAAEFAELLRESEHATGGSYARLHRMAREVAAALPLDKDAAELAELIGRANGLPRAGQ